MVEIEFLNSKSGTFHYENGILTAKTSMGLTYIMTFSILQRCKKHSLEWKALVILMLKVWRQAWASALTYGRVFGVSSKMSILLIKLLTFSIFTLSLALTSLFTNSFLVIAYSIKFWTPNLHSTNLGILGM